MLVDNQILVEISPQVGVDFSTENVRSVVGITCLSTANKQVREPNQFHVSGELSTGLSTVVVHSCE